MGYGFDYSHHILPQLISALLYLIFKVFSDHSRLKVPKPQKVKKIKMNSHSKVTDQTPIFIDSSPALSPIAEEMEISMLLTPPGYSIYDGDCFTQPEFDALFAFVMNQITIYCRDNYPKNFLEHEARVKLYMDISRGFKFANVHNLIPKYEDGMPHGSSSGGNNTLRRILQVVD
ncbi:hypothetical protein PGT21_032697 [Puccinia graminis f. sp. tritici]|uniref:Uncharacterized protein n=1 Tax=Puccinia graminis f. sp. tritici TaxID=56615 RepID=A0A5B0PD82_PUCGR|nr:hypothetical protein PGTUg99_017785 [Puccinia graminis f. sp. tritici]KAA1104840.1 hypothetical protein PGT21_032697 [Puccinia graminis f. sp. tritici]